MTDRWSDPDLVWALFQAALAVPLAVAILAMLAVLACIGLFCAGYALQAVVRWLWERRWWQRRPTPPVPPELWTAESLRAMTHKLLIRDAVDAVIATPWLADPQVDKTIHIPRLSHLGLDPKSLKDETEDGQRAEIWIDGKPHQLPTATRSYIVTDNGIEPVQGPTAAAVGGK